jgi:hypothetical protein
VTLIDQFQRIDQSELQKLGLREKNSLTEDAIPELHQYTMLQRFRQGRDFRQADPEPAPKKGKQLEGKENKWWLRGGNVP